MTDVAETAIHPKERLAADLKAVIADAEELLQITSTQTGEKAVELRARLGESLRVARHKMQDADAALREKARATAEATDVYVHDNPWKAIGIAAGAGLLVGLLIGRR